MSKNIKQITSSLCKTRKICVCIGITILATSIAIFATTYKNGSTLKGELDPNFKIPTECNGINIKSIPSPLYSNTSSVIIIESDPPGWQGNIKISASEGSFNDSEQEGANIVTDKRIFNYSGGRHGTTITVQAEDSTLSDCFNTIQITE